MGKHPAPSLLLSAILLRDTTQPGAKVFILIILFRRSDFFFWSPLVMITFEDFLNESNPFWPFRRMFCVLFFTGSSKRYKERFRSTVFIAFIIKKLSLVWLQQRSGNSSLSFAPSLLSFPSLSPAEKPRTKAHFPRHFIPLSPPQKTPRLEWSPPPPPTAHVAASGEIEASPPLL